MKPNQQLRHERELRGWSQARVAEALGTNAATVSRWECGYAFPVPHFREKLCELFARNAEELGLLQEESASEYAYHDLNFPIAVNSSGHALMPAAPQALLDPAMPSLPAEVARLSGRDALLYQLKQRLASGGGSALAALGGVPGVGKTALALSLAHDQDIRRYFRDGILWVGLGPRPQVLRHLKRWGSLLGIASSEHPAWSNCAAWAEAIRATIGPRRMLLVIDDAWRCEEALAFKIGGANCGYIVTTRFPQIALHCAAGSAVFVQELSEDDGIALLAQSVPEIVASEPRTAQALVRLVGGLPLALTLMGRYLRYHAHTQQPRRVRAAIDRLLDTEVRLQLSEPQPLLGLHTSLPQGLPISLQAVIGASEQYIDEQAQEALRALAVFPAKPSSFSEEAALAVCDLPVETFDQLYDAGLLESRGAGRYMLSRTVADYGYVHLRASAAYTPVRERMVRYMLDYAVAHARDLDLLDQEACNILAALRGAYRRGMREELVRGVSAFAPFLLTRGWYALADLHLQRAHQAARELDDAAGRATMLLYLADVTEKLGDYALAEAYVQEGLDLARQLASSGLLCDLLLQRGWVAYKRGAYAQAEGYYREGLHLARQSEHSGRLSSALTCMGLMVLEQGDYEQALTYFQEGLALAQCSNLPARISDLLACLGDVARRRGEHTRAESYFQEALALARQHGRSDRVSLLLSRLGEIARELGDYAQAERYVQEGLSLARPQCHLERIGLLLLTLGAVSLDRGNYAQAETAFQEGLSLARQIEQWMGISYFLSLLGWVAWKRGEYTRMDAYYQEALRLSRQFEHRESICHLLSNLGMVAGERGDYAQAERYLQEGLSLARQIGHREEISQLLTTLGKIAAECGDYTQAEDYLHEGLDLAQQVGVRWLMCEVLHERGEVELKRRRLETAAATFRKALAHAPHGHQERTAKVLYALGRVTALQGDLPEARKFAAASLAIFEAIDNRKRSTVRDWLASLPAMEAQ